MAAAYTVRFAAAAGRGGRILKPGRPCDAVWCMIVWTPDVRILYATDLHSNRAERRSSKSHDAKFPRPFSSFAPVHIVEAT